MLNDKENTSTASKQTDSKKPLKIKQFKSIEFDNSTGGICDVNTGICGPLNQEKEGKK